jgi:hypothetical protein
MHNKNNPLTPLGGALKGLGYSDVTSHGIVLSHPSPHSFPHYVMYMLGIVTAYAYGVNTLYWAVPANNLAALYVYASEST